MNENAVGFIGLGRMGFGMASNLAKAGVSLTAFDVRPESMEAIIEHGVSAAANPADLASRAQILFLCLPSAMEVDFRNPHIYQQLCSSVCYTNPSLG